MKTSTALGTVLGLVFLLGAPYAPADQKEMPSDLAKASDLIGKDVVNSQGQSLGEVQNIVIDTANGRVAYAVLSFGGFLGIGDKYFAIPWQAFQKQPGKDQLVLDVDKDKLKSAPGFNKDHWPDMANREWAREVNHFYGVRPAMEIATSRVYNLDFGERSLQRETANLPLKFEQGKTYHYTIVSQPYGQGSFASPESGSRESWTQGSQKEDRGQNQAQERSREQSRSSGSQGPETAGNYGQGQAGGQNQMACRHEAWLKVNQLSGNEATLSFTFDASKCEACKQQAKQAGREPPGKVTYTVRANRDGEILSFEREGGQSGNRQMGSWEEVLKLQCRQLLGEGLHDQQLEPGKTYDVAWMSPMPGAGPSRPPWRGRPDRPRRLLPARTRPARSRAPRAAPGSPRDARRGGPAS